jgi:hypothetical protein
MGEQSQKVSGRYGGRITGWIARTGFGGLDDGRALFVWMRRGRGRGCRRGRRTEEGKEGQDKRRGEERRGGVWTFLPNTSNRGVAELADVGWRMGKIIEGEWRESEKEGERERTKRDRQKPSGAGDSKKSQVAGAGCKAGKSFS